ncbi:unnamed protein product [Allacma fusca]|uniref:Orc1-like AAA ATPase domain-containing protein n=1 Tax=Allacma fusca TaxID=39272 RepID=A0A8J2P132_9HEXA|nr:unnamed protein product [Allacma fusca]
MSFVQIETNGKRWRHQLAALALGYEKLQGPVSKIKLISSPVFNFTGREKQLKEIDSAFETVSAHKSGAKNVVLCGLGGIGKTELAKFYGNQKVKQGYSVVLIEAGRDSSVRSSFVHIARTLRICSNSILEQSEISLDDVKLLATGVYQHFSQYIKNGLFIFNNAEGMTTSKLGFGIRGFLPNETLQNPPRILITSRKTTWGCVGEMVERISVEPLSNDEVQDFLTRTFGLNKCQQQLDKDFVSVLNEFGSLFQGFPLALSNATVTIMRKFAWEPELYGKDDHDYSNYISTHLPQLLGGLKWYIHRFNEPGADWMDDHVSESVTHTNELILKNVWSATFDNIKQLDGGNVALELQNILAYLNPDHIFISVCDSIYFDKTYDKYGIRRREQLKPELQEALKLLELYSMISIEYNEASKIPRDMVRVHSLVQKCSRAQARNTDALVKCLRYIHRYFKTCRLPSNHIYAVLDYAKEAKWPEDTILLCLNLCLKTLLHSNVRCDYILEYLQNMRSDIAGRMTYENYARIVLGTFYASYRLEKETNSLNLEPRMETEIPSCYQSDVIPLSHGDKCADPDPSPRPALSDCIGEIKQLSVAEIVDVNLLRLAVNGIYRLTFIHSASEIFTGETLPLILKWIDVTCKTRSFGSEDTLWIEVLDILEAAVALDQPDCIITPELEQSIFQILVYAFETITPEKCIPYLVFIFGPNSQLDVTSRSPNIPSTLFKVTGSTIISVIVSYLAKNEERSNRNFLSDFYLLDVILQKILKSKYSSVFAGCNNFEHFRVPLEMLHTEFKSFTDDAWISIYKLNISWIKIKLTKRTTRLPISENCEWCNSKYPQWTATAPGKSCIEQHILLEFLLSFYCEQDFQRPKMSNVEFLAKMFKTISSVLF